MVNPESSQVRPFTWGRQGLWCKVLTTATIFGLILRVRILMGSAEEILECHGSDDLFYYTQVALHWFKDGVPSIDGLHPTTGFQPLFALFLMPASGGFTGDTLFSLRVTLGLASLLTLVLAWSCPGLMVRWLGRAWGKPAGTLLGCLFLLHPRWLELEFSGTEATLTALAWAWVLSHGWIMYFSRLSGLGNWHAGLGGLLDCGNSTSHRLCMGAHLSSWRTRAAG